MLPIAAGSAMAGARPVTRPFRNTGSGIAGDGWGIEGMLCPGHDFDIDESTYEQPKPEQGDNDEGDEE
jgi:hypothetical protein